MFSGRSSYAIQGPNVVETTYNAYPVNVPKDFLAPLYDPSLIKLEWVTFKESIPEYDGCVAAVIDNLLSERECRELIHLAETATGLHQQSTTNDEDNGDPSSFSQSKTVGGQGKPGQRGWQPALVSAGYGSEITMKDYRNSDRIIWDNVELTRRIWTRMMQVPDLKDRLAELKGEDYERLGGNPRKFIARAKEYGVNERLRFLRYGPGQFFKREMIKSVKEIAHADSMFTSPNGEKSYFTVHLYLNDSAEALQPNDIHEETLRGGSTPFLSANRKRRLDVWPKAGRVLLFQQRKLVHCGDRVNQGVKYTVRSEVMYDLIPVDADAVEDAKKQKTKKQAKQKGA
ncbi:hypothetical protein KEM56_007145 [Ascosphaera pollenicola]|nr:hypothetical protein KEM56_007145 [Ascosphaera pollenicola]